MSSPSQDVEIVEALALRRRGRLNLLLVALVIAGAAVWTGWQTGFDIPELIEGTPHIYNLLARMFPPDLSIVHNLYGPVLETLAMALLGATLPLFLALPLACLTAVTIRPDPVLGGTIRILLHTLRTIPELLWAMLLVSAIGLGPFPGTLALVLHNTGSMGKFFYETIESADPGVIEAMQATGANRFKVIMFGILPNVLPNIMSVTLLYWEFSSRAATILGLVGAGGIGLTLTHAIQDFNYHEAMTCLIVIVLILAVIDRISAYLRKRVI